MLSSATMMDMARNGEFNIIYGDGFFCRADKSRLLTEKQIRKELLSLMATPSVKKPLEMLEIIKQMYETDFDMWEIFAKHNKLADIEPNDYFEKLYPTVPFLKNILYDVMFGKSQRLYLLRGVPKAGKSRVMDFLRGFFGDFCKSKTLSAFNGSFGASGVQGSLLIFGDDLGAEHLDGNASGGIKSMTTGEEISINRKFIEEYDIKVHANFLFGCNKPVTYDYGDSGLHRRFCEVFFDTPLNWTKQEYVDNCRYIRDNIKGIAKWVKTAEDMDNEAIYNYLCVKTATKKLHGLPKDYVSYQNWCNKNGKKSGNVDTFNALHEAYKSVSNDAALVPNWVLDYEKKNNRQKESSIVQGVQTSGLLGDGDYLPF